MDQRQVVGKELSAGGCGRNNCSAFSSPTAETETDATFDVAICYAAKPPIRLMSIEAMNWALNQKTGSSAAKSVLLILANRADHDGVCWPGIDGIAKQTELATRTVVRAVKKLQERKMVSIEHRGGTGEGRKSNVYRLHIHRQSVTASHCDSPEKPGGIDTAMCQNGTKGQSDTDDRQSDSVSRQSDTLSPEPKDNPKKNRQRDARENLNEKAWQEYIDHRKATRLKKLTDHGERIHIRNLSKLSMDDQQRVVDQTISNGWTGLFPEKLLSSGAGKKSYSQKLRDDMSQKGML